jgi:cysteine desulfurase
MTDPIYLDHNATTPLLPAVLAGMLPYLEREHGNPSSAHPYGRRARDAVELARARVAALIGCSAQEIVFTSGGTEANNLAIHGVTSERRQIVTTAIEHPAVARPCALLGSRGYALETAPVGRDGVVDVGELSERTALVTVMHANNETGILQPVAEIAERAHAKGIVVHTDAAQTVGKIAVDVDRLGVDLLTIAGHKMNAPKGVGALYVRRGTPLRPYLLGAGHERGLRPGTENVASIVGLGVACEIAKTDLQARTTMLAELRDRLHERLSKAIPDVVANGTGPRLPNTLSLRFPAVLGSALLEATPEVAASTGSACHEGHESPSPVLIAMGLSREDALCTVRLSVGTTTTHEDVDAAADALARRYRELRASRPERPHDER